MYETLARIAALVTVAGAVIMGIVIGAGGQANAATFHHHHKPHHSAAYYRLHPCAPGHPPVSPDWGVCLGQTFRAS